MTRSKRKWKLNMWLLRIRWVGLVGWLMWGVQTQSAMASNVPKENNRSDILYRSGLQRGLQGPQARRLLSVLPTQHGIRLRADGAIPSYEVMTLQNPARLVLDIYRIKRARWYSIRRRLQRVSCENTAFRRVRIGKHRRKIRIVFDACSATLPAYQIKLTTRGLRLRLKPHLAQHTVRPVATAKSSDKVPTTIADIGYGENQRHSNVLIRFLGPAPTVSKRVQGRTMILDIPQATLAKELQRTLDTSEFRGALESIHTTRTAKGVRITVQLRRNTTEQLHTQKGQLTWQFAMPSQPTAPTASVAQIQQDNSQDGYQIHYQPQRVGQAGGNNQMTAGDLALLSQRRGAKRYTGRRISIFFRKVEIHNLLRLFSEISGMNIITSDSVKGRITLKLRNVPWDQALDIVLRTLKLGMEKSGNIARIATLDELRQEEEQRRKLQELKLLAQPQKIRLIPVNYAKANEMATKVRTVLSPRGKVNIDNRTNVLIVKDYVPFLLRAEGLVRSLDTQTPQVLIQARIVEANVNFSREFGIQWGGHLLFSPLTGNSTGLQFPNPVGIRGGVPATAGGGGGGATGGQGDFGTPNYVINFPATTGLGQGTALSFLFGSLSGVGNLHLRLSAAESAGNVKIISAPKIITLHKMSASIQQGLQIPFSSASAAGTNVQFVTASLSLNVTPQVTADGSVFLQLNISNNAPDFSKGGAAGPAITTKTAQTNMLIKDGETMVIGGIYSRRTGSSQSRVPFLSQIPVIGLLFKNYTYNDDRAELLVFVTPRIINRAQIIGGRQGQ